MKKFKTKIILLSILFSFFLNTAFSQLGKDRKIRWEEQDSTSYVEIKNGKFGIVTKGKATIPTKYQIEQLNEAICWDGNAYYRDSAHFALGLEGKWGVMNNWGTVIVPFEYDYIQIQRNQDNDRMEFAGVEKNGKCAIMNEKGKLITGFDYDAFYGYYKNDMMRANNASLAMRIGNKVVFYDPVTGKNLNSAPVQEYGVESKIVYYKMKMGAISQNGDVLLPVEYDFVNCTNNRAFENRNQALSVGNEDKYGIWQYGNGFILPMLYQSTNVGYVDGKMLFVAGEKDKYALLDAAGKKLTAFEYDSLSISFGDISGFKGDDYYEIKSDGKATLIRQ